MSQSHIAPDIASTPEVGAFEEGVELADEIKSREAMQSRHDGNHHATASTNSDRKVGVVGLVAIVISAMVGGGIFNLPQNLSQHASAGSQIIAWIITAVGMWFIAGTFRVLAEVRPELKDGLYNYAYHGFGRFAGFLVSYGYWICNCCALVAYGILLMTTLNTFFPYFGEGNNIPAIIGASLVIWLSLLVGLRGAKSNTVIYVIGTICKLVPIGIFLVAMVCVFKVSLFVYGFWGLSASGEPLRFSFAQVFPQVRDSMLVTLWLFIGFEGAVVVSGQAKSQKAVARATSIGYTGVLVCYMLVSLLPLGSFDYHSIGAMNNPAMAVLLDAVVGSWGSAVVSIGIVVSVLFAMLVWMLMLSQMPYYGSLDGLYPRMFRSINSREVPYKAMLVAACICEVLLISTYFLGNKVWNTVTSVTATLAMPCYLLCCMYLIKVSRSRTHWPTDTRFTPRKALVTGICGTIFSLFLVCSAGLHYLSMVCVIYALGIGLFVAGRRQNGAAGSVAQLFSVKERIIVVLIVISGIGGIIYTAIHGL